MNRWRGDWALITGASAGIGREFAVQLSSAGMNCILIARREGELQTLATQMRASDGTRSLILPIDLGEAGAVSVVKERVETQGLRVRVLVNNAAFGKWGRFEGASGADYARMLVLNNSTPVELCLAFLSHLRSFERSAIINVTSQAALQPVPFMAVYAASKSFLHNFSLALYEEWKSYGIAVHSLIPAPSETEFDEKAGAYATRLIERRPPTEAVQLALARMGEDLPVISSAKGLFKQHLANALLPPKRLLHEVAKLFRPPNEN